jgi:hypothetical protein
MYFRYSSRVVAPMQCSSPRARRGFSKFEASIEPSAAPAPTTVWSSSMNRMISPSADWTSFRTAFKRSSNSPRNLARRRGHPCPGDHPPVAKAFGDVAARDSLGEPLDDRGLSDAGLADQHRIVLGAARQDLDRPPDLVVAPDHRVELAAGRELGQVAAELLERLVSGFRVGAGHALVAAHCLQAPRRLGRST